MAIASCQRSTVACSPSFLQVAPLKDPADVGLERDYSARHVMSVIASFDIECGGTGSTWQECTRHLMLEQVLRLDVMICLGFKFVRFVIMAWRKWLSIPYIREFAFAKCKFAD